MWRWLHKTRARLCCARRCPTSYYAALAAPSRESCRWPSRNECCVEPLDQQRRAQAALAQRRGRLLVPDNLVCITVLASWRVRLIGVLRDASRVGAEAASADQTHTRTNNNNNSSISSTHTNTSQQTNMNEWMQKR